MSAAPLTPGAPELVTVELDDDACLALLARDGRAELARAGVLRGRARVLAEHFGADAREDEVAAWLLAEGAPDAARARDDARRFLAELAALGPGPAAPRAPAPPSHQQPASSDLRPESWTHLARAVLARGQRLRFRAHGRSMRPFLPPGTELEVAPRTLAEVRLGEVVLHAGERAPLVAHRVVGRQGAALVTRGDSNARRERVEPAAFLGVVVAGRRAGEWRRLDRAGARWLGLVTGLAYGLAVTLARWLVLRPLRGTYARPSLLRATLRLLLRGASGSLLLLERAAVRLRRPLDVLRAALYSSAEKDAERTRLYARRAIQDFTALDENVRSGLTLLEEVLLARHPLQGRVLVLGCGPGREALVLARRGCTVTGLDREPGMLARARELAGAEGLVLEWREGEAEHFELGGEPFDAVVIFSGLYNMLLPAERRVRMLASARAHLVPGGRVFLTFLAAYRRPGEEDEGGKHLLEALNPEHERGDLYLLNEAIHVFPRDEDVRSEASRAGLATRELFRDQRAYDRPAGQVRGYAVLERSR